MRRLFSGGRVRTMGEPAAGDWLLVDDGIVSAVGETGDEPEADQVIDLHGGTLLPSFCDAHVHLPATGLQESALDFTGVSSVKEIVEAFARRAEAGGLLFGANFEDPLDRPMTRHELDAAVGNRPAVLARADLHSCVISSALLEEISFADAEGVDRDEDGSPTGYLRERAANGVWRWVDESMSAGAMSATIEAGIRRAYSRGVTEVHEMHVVECRGWKTLDVLVDVVNDHALSVVPYVASEDVDRVAERGFGCMGGDLFLDGSFGSHTAWLSEPYTSSPPAGCPDTGIAYRSDDLLLEVFTKAQERGLQTGVHAIGDAAIEQAIRIWEKVAGEHGIEAVRRIGHRIEHFECATDDHLRRAAQLGLRASVQPAFDAVWGGKDGLYARRIGPERALRMNRFASMLDAGLVVGAGSDSTVTPLHPFLQMAALRDHHVEAERLSPREALAAHVTGARALAGTDEDAGRLVPGARADLVLVDRDPVAVATEELRSSQVLGTWIGGHRVWPIEEAEVQ